MVSTTTGTGGGVRGLKNKLPWLYWPWRGDYNRNVLDCLCSGMVLRDVCGLPARTLSPSVQLTRTATEQQRQHKEQTGREGKLAEASREEFKGSESEKITDKGWGGSEKKRVR
jgi:hypothetical protein